MPRPALAALAAVALAAAGCGRGTPAGDPAPPRLAAGADAPPLAGVAWLNGPGFTRFEPGTVYVLDFWATWCGPCLQAMPHLAQLQREYKDRGVVVAPVTTLDGENTKDAVERYVAKVGPRYGLPFAVCDTPATDGAYLKAAGVTGIPTSFVIDRAGKVAFIGHPYELDDVLPRVVAGTWDAGRDRPAVAAGFAAVQRLADAADDPARAEQVVARFEAEYPEKAKQPVTRITKVAVLAQAKRTARAAAEARALLPVLAAHRDERLLAELARVWLDRDVNPAGEHLDLAREAADKHLDLVGRDDVGALMLAAEVAARQGDKAAAKRLATEAAGHAKSDRQKAEIEKRAAGY